jgi:hypothetical protein
VGSLPILEYGKYKNMCFVLFYFLLLSLAESHNHCEAATKSRRRWKPKAELLLRKPLAKQKSDIVQIVKKLSSKNQAAIK